MKILFPVWLLQGIPENLAIVSLALAMSGQKLKLNNVLTIGLIQAILIYLIRQLPITFGVHTIIATISLGTLLHLTVKTRLSNSFLYSLLAYVILAVAETAFISLFLTMFHLSFEQVFNNPWLMILAGWPQVIALFFLALIICKLRKQRLPQEKS